MAYATITDVQDRMTRTLTGAEISVCENLLDDISILIDAYNSSADNDIKKAVSCRAVVRALGSGDDVSVPIGASQGSMSAMGYSQSWTIGANGAVGEIYLSKTEKTMLGLGNRIGSYSPIEEMTGGDL